jgi:hypothetical protein
MRQLGPGPRRPGAVGSPRRPCFDQAGRMRRSRSPGTAATCGLGRHRSQHAPLQRRPTHFAGAQDRFLQGTSCVHKLRGDRRRDAGVVRGRIRRARSYPPARHRASAKAAGAGPSTAEFVPDNRLRWKRERTKRVRRIARCAGSGRLGIAGQASNTEAIRGNVSRLRQPPADASITGAGCHPPKQQWQRSPNATLATFRNPLSRIGRRSQGCLFPPSCPPIWPPTCRFSFMRPNGHLCPGFLPGTQLAHAAVLSIKDQSRTLSCV